MNSHRKFISQEMQRSFDEKNVEMLQEVMNRLPPEVSASAAAQRRPGAKMKPVSVCTGSKITPEEVHRLWTLGP